MSRFELFGAESSEMAVTSYSIVEGIDVVGYSAVASARFL